MSLAAQAETVVLCEVGFHLYVFGALSSGWLPGIDDSLAANSKGFHRTKIWLQKVYSGEKSHWCDTWWSTIGRSTPVGFHVCSRTHVNTCALHKRHIAFQLFQSPQAGKVNGGGGSAQITEGFRNNFIKKIPLLLFISVFLLSVFLLFYDSLLQCLSSP